MILFPLFATSVVDTSGNLPPVSLYRWQIATGDDVNTGGNFAAGIASTGINNTSGNGGKFAASGLYTSGKFSTGVVDTGGAPSLANISANF